MRTHLEPIADCYAGIWTYFVQKRGLLDSGGLKQVPAALSVGDSQNHSEHTPQRRHWFEQGLATGNLKSCDV